MTGLQREGRADDAQADRTAGWTRTGRRWRGSQAIPPMPDQISACHDACPSHRKLYQTMPCVAPTAASSSMSIASSGSRPRPAVARAAPRDMKPLAVDMIHEGDHPVPEAGDVEQGERLGVIAERVPAPRLEQFVERADAAGHGDEGVGKVGHLRLALVHVGDEVQLGEAGMRDLEVDQRLSGSRHTPCRPSPARCRRSRPSARAVRRRRRGRCRARPSLCPSVARVASAKAGSVPIAGAAIDGEPLTCFTATIAFRSALRPGAEMRDHFGRRDRADAEGISARSAPRAWPTRKPAANRSPAPVVSTTPLPIRRDRRGDSLPLLHRHRARGPAGHDERAAPCPESRRSRRRSCRIRPAP